MKTITKYFDFMKKITKNEMLRLAIQEKKIISIKNVSVFSKEFHSYKYLKK